MNRVPIPDDYVEETPPFELGNLEDFNYNEAAARGILVQVPSELKRQFVERKHKYLLHKNTDQTIEILDKRLGRKEKAQSLLSEHEK